jgi:hypothetical protein
LQASAVSLPESAAFNPEHVAPSVVLNAEQFGSWCWRGVGGGAGAAENAIGTRARSTRANRVERLTRNFITPVQGQSGWRSVVKGQIAQLTTASFFSVFVLFARPPLLWCSHSLFFLGRKRGLRFQNGPPWAPPPRPAISGPPAARGRAPRAPGPCSLACQALRSASAHPFHPHSTLPLRSPLFHSPQPLSECWFVLCASLFVPRGKRGYDTDTHR